MQRHLDKGYDRVPLVVPLLFYHGETSPYPYSLNWLDEFDDPQLARQLYTELFRWWILPSYLTMRSCNIGVSA